MGKHSNFFKRAQTWVLTVAMLLTVFQPILGFVVVAEDKTPVDITVGQLVVNNYDELTDSEKALIESGLLVGDETLTYTKPDTNNGDEVISVNTDDKTVTVKAYKDGGYTWKPAETAKLVLNGAVLETLTLVDGKATYEYDGNAFAVVVDYKLEVEVDEAVQNGLLAAPTKLSDAVAKLDAIAGVDLSAVVMALPELEVFASEDGMLCYTLFGSPAYIELADAVKPAVNALVAQLKANSGKLDIQLLVDAYNAAEHKVEFAIENGEEIMAKAVETYEYLAVVLDGFDYEGEISNKDSLLGKIDTIDEMLKLIPEDVVGAADRKKVQDARKSVNTAIDVFEAVVNGLEAPCASGWESVDGIVKAGLTDVQLEALDGYVASIAIPTTGIAVKNPLYVETVSVQHNMSMFNVTVNVELELTGDNNAVGKVDTVTTTVTLAEGATTAEILAAVEASGVVDNALAKWTDKYADGKFDIEKTALPAELKADTVYTITYTPKTFNVNYAGNNVAYPYGATVVLEKHADATKAYDYEVNGTPYAQGEYFVVEGDTDITREEGKSYTASTLFNIIANNYLSGKGAAILTSGALFGDVAVNVRYPGDEDELVSLDGKKLTAKKYAASYEDLSWTAYSYTLTKGGVESEPVLFNGAETVEISESFDYVTVIYRLNFTNFSEDTVLGFANLPHVLAEESAAQKAALDRIAAKNGTLAQLKKAVLSVAAESINDSTLNADPAKDAALKASFTTAFNGIINECYSGTTMKLSTLIDAYLASGDKLAHYYAHHEEIRAEIALLANYLSTMLAEEAGLTKDDKKAALEVLLTDLAAGTGMLTAEDIKKYVDNFESIEEIMNSVLDDLSAPNAAIDLESPNLGKLTAALDGAAVDAVNSYKGLYLTSVGFTETSDDQTLITVNVNVNGTTVSVTSALMYNVDTVSAKVIGDLIEAINAKIPGDSAYYNSNYNEVVAALNALVGEQAGSVTKNYTINYTYKEFTVSVPETEDQTVTAVDKVINLPASGNAGFKYVYFVNGKEVPTGNYTLTDADFAALVAGNLKITLKKVDVLRQNLIDYVDSLNANSGDTVKFALVENNGEYSIVLKIDGLQPNALMSAVMGTAQGMITGDYAYVGLDGKAFLDGKIYLQSVLDAFMNSGFGDKTIVDVMDANGNINNMKLSGTVISNTPVAPYGGELLATTMQLGNTADDAIDVDFYVTLGSVSEEMVQVRNVLAGKVSNYFGLVCDDGHANLSVNLPEKAYEAFLAMLLVTEKIDIANINAVNSEIAISFFHNLFMPTLNTPGVTVNTFDNTLSKFGFDLDLSSQRGAERLYNYLVNFYTTANYTYDEETGYMVNNLSISAAIDAMNLGSLGNMIAEKDTGLNVALSLTIEDLGHEYDALFVDITADGIANKAGLSTDIASKVKDIEGTAVIVLLDNVDADLTINTTTLLNLNGFTVNGDLNCKGKTIVVDTRVADGVNGGVTGEVTGNAIILGGKYADDVSAFTKNGYVQNSEGVVNNKFYDIVEDSEGNVIVELNAGVIHTDSIPSIPGLAIDLACDLLFNGYSSNYLEIAGNTVYDISFEDLVGIYASTDRVNRVVDEVVNIVDSAELSALVNLVLDDVFNFTAISEAIKADEPVLSYEMITKPWSVEFSHVSESDYITVGIVSGEPAIVRNLNIVIVGEDADKAYFADLFAELGRTVSADINVNINHGLDGKELFAEVSADANVYVDYTNPNYAVMFSVIIADGIGAPANTALVEGIKEFYATNGDISDLAFAFNSLTVNQVVTALKNLSLNDDFDAMVTRLGLDGIVPSKVAELEDLYDRIGKVAAAAVRKADITGGNRKLGTFLDADGAYGMSRSNFARYLERNLFKGYFASAAVEVTDFYVGVKLFADDVLELLPEFVDGTGTPDLTFSDKLVGYQIDFDGNYIIIDTHANGITADELKALINLYADNADYIDIAFGENLSGDSLVPNGTKLLATAGNEFTDEVDTVEYTVIILGDINGNGTVEVGDAVLITRHLVYDQELSTVQKLAADTSNNGRIDVGDAVRITRKKLYWDEYKSLLEEVED